MAQTIKQDKITNNLSEHELLKQLKAEYLYALELQVSLEREDQEKHYNIKKYTNCLNLAIALMQTKMASNFKPVLWNTVNKQKLTAKQLIQEAEKIFSSNNTNNNISANLKLKCQLNFMAALVGVFAFVCLIAKRYSITAGLNFIHSPAELIPIILLAAAATMFFMYAAVQVSSKEKDFKYNLRSFNSAKKDIETWGVLENITNDLTANKQ